MIKEIEIAIVNAANRALKMYSKAPNLSTEETIKKIMPFLEGDDMNEKAKVAAIAAVNGVLKIKRQHKELLDREIIEKFLKENKAALDERISS
jgi:hypothetical protein